ncbi:hypothetical protein ACHQM5_017224 [Ranunculus cassubicifolius]
MSWNPIYVLFKGGSSSDNGVGSSNTNSVSAEVLEQGRKSCYQARDAFYTCLNKEWNKKPSQIACVGLLYPVDCSKPREEFVKQCRPSWVKHFDRQYCVKKKAQRLLDNDGARRGPTKLPQT